jgi:hypothetical protein
VFHKLQETRPIEGIAIRALEAVKGWISSNSKYFADISSDNHGMEADNNVTYGWRLQAEIKSKRPSMKNETYIAIDVNREILEKFLEDNGYSPGRCESDWRDAGVIVCDSGRFTSQAYHKGNKIRCIRFREETMNDIVCGE